MPPGSSRTPIDRRAFLRSAASLLVLPPSVAAVCAASPVVRRRRLLQMGGHPINAETPLDALTTYITPNDLFFIRHHWNPAIPDPATWTLTVDGEVRKPLRLTLAALKALPRATATCVLQCAGNGRALHRPPVPGLQWRYGAVGNARWTGVRVRDLLAQAGVESSAMHLHTFGADVPPEKVPPFHRSLELAKAREDALVAYEMNGEPLPPLHGAPARLVVPGWAGEHWMKWLVRLSAQRRPQTGFYMDVGYRYPKTAGEPGVTFKPEEMRPVTELFVKSNVTEFPTRARVGVPATIRGFAFSGAPDIVRVELSDDDGATWTRARLDGRHDPYAWRLWSHVWTPRAAGRFTLVARATDDRGSAQPRRGEWNQSGYLYNAWHGVEIQVTA